jgi:hypothetical protein
MVWQNLGIVVLIWLGLRWCDRPTLATGAALGTAGGLVALININPIPIFAVALAAFPDRRSFDVHMLRAAMLSAITATLIVAPWIARDAVMFGRFYPIR